MSTRVRDYWLSHPEYWIASGVRQYEADQAIYATFKDYDFTQEDNFGIVVYLDQFLRHFSRVEPFSETTIQTAREEAAEIVRNFTTDHIKSVSEQELVWYLMPWKHLTQWEPLFQTIHVWLNDRSITEYPLLNKFFMDSYRKAYTASTVADNLVLATTSAPYNPAAICESYPALYAAATTPETLRTWRELPFNTSSLTETLSANEPMTISLSGGVDSMLMAALLKRKGADVIAAHIVYGNRKESVDERDFITNYCQKLGIPLYIYTVEWLRRETTDRAFYEEMTRSLRFSVYKALERPVFLGHIQEDAIENIWTNFAHGTHLNDLMKFHETSIEDDVQICRPWLRIRKSLIYETADALAIPHLKNTTPTWSNRGKFRNHFYAATHAQYGEHVDEKVLEVAERIHKQSTLLERLLFQPISNSWDPIQRRINITQAAYLELDGEGWLRILTDIAHRRLHIGKPTFAAAQNFAERIRRSVENGQIITIRRDFVVRICKIAKEIWLVVK